MKKKSRGPTEHRGYGRLTRHERNQIEQMLDQGKSCRQIAFELGRAPSTVACEVTRHRFVTSPRAHFGELAPADLSEVCERLGTWPRCCNGCKRRRGYGCNLRPHVFYSARMAQRKADATRSESRRGIDETEQSVAAKLKAIRAGLKQGLSPAQIAATSDLDLSASTIYRWVEAGYGEMTCLELRRKVGYKPRRRAGPHRRKKHSQARSFEHFCSLAEDTKASAWEMDSVLGRKQDDRRLLTLYHRPTSFQLVLPLEDGSCRAVVDALGGLRDVLGPCGMGGMFGLVLTDNGPEFSDEERLGALLGESPGETRLFFCEPGRADQKGGCEKNHVEIRKLLPKGKGIRFDRLKEADCALIMSQINSEPRGKLGFRTPAEMFRAVFGPDAEAILEAFGIEELEVSKLDLTAQCLEKAREKRGEAPLAS